MKQKTRSKLILRGPVSVRLASRVFVLTACSIWGGEGPGSRAGVDKKSSHCVGNVNTFNVKAGGTCSNQCVLLKV
jgi:hypothetical protein